MKNIKLAYLPPAPGIKAGSYKVLTVKNSILYFPGEILSEVVVDSLCRNTHWDVTVVPSTGGGHGT